MGSLSGALALEFVYFSIFHSLHKSVTGMKKKLCGRQMMGRSGYMREHLENPKVPGRRVKIFWRRQSAGKSRYKAGPLNDYTLDSADAEMI